MASTNYLPKIPALMSALTHVHVGAGRSPGAVDLPIIRDPFGIPFIPGSSVKGALKTKMAIEKNCLKDGEVNCNKCTDVCCLLGPEKGEEGASRLIITDFYPLLIPVPSLNHGYAYVTFNRLLKYAEGLGLKIEPEDSSNEAKETITIGIEEYKAIKVMDIDKIVGKGLAGEVHPFLRTKKEVYLLEDKYAKYILDRVTVKLTRIKLNRETKTVSKGMLWTEEYLPHGTVLIGAFIERRWNNTYCKDAENVDKWEEALGFQNDHTELVLGGKETVGKGLVRIILAQQR